MFLPRLPLVRKKNKRFSAATPRGGDALFWGRPAIHFFPCFCVPVRPGGDDMVSRSGDPAGEQDVRSAAGSVVRGNYPGGDGDQDPHVPGRF